MISMKIVIPVTPRVAVEKLMERFKREESSLLREFGKKVEQELRRRIKQQKLEVPGLTPAYLAEKARRKWSLKTLIRTGGYMNSIRAQYTNGSLKLLPVGEDPISGVKYSEIARHLEFGTRRMPARPHWRPMIPWAKKAFSKYIRSWAEKVLAEVIEDQSQRKGK